MKVKIIMQTENELKVEIEGAGHGICNLLQKRLLEDKKVDQAGYDVPHPLASNPVIYVRMKGKASPLEAFLEAAEKAEESNKVFSEAFKAALKA
jgi:DNA-directed RNA polymerase subunit L